MKTKVRISFNALPLPGGAETILGPAGCGNDVAEVRDVPVLRQVFVDVNLDEGDERVARVFALLKQYGVEPSVSGAIEYSEEDRQNAQLLTMRSTSDIDVFAGFQYGTEFDLTNACSHCKTGGKQLPMLYVDNDGIATIRKHRAVMTYSREILVDGGMAKKLKDAGITGISFGDVRARLKNGKWTSVAREQILIEHVMPPMRVEPTEYDEKYLCQVCRRGGRMTSLGNLYRQEDLVGIKDFNLTWEWFGEFGPAEPGRRERRSHPSVRVTPKVMNIFRDAGVKTFEWYPVDIET